MYYLAIGVISVGFISLIRFSSKKARIRAVLMILAMYGAFVLWDLFINNVPFAASLLTGLIYVVFGLIVAVLGEVLTRTYTFIKNTDSDEELDDYTNDGSLGEGGTVIMIGFMIGAVLLLVYLGLHFVGNIDWSKDSP